MKCLAGVESADSGTVESLSNTNIVFVEQDPKWDNSLVYEMIFSAPTEEAFAVRKYMNAMNPLLDYDDDSLVDAADRMTAANAWVI